MLKFKKMKKLIYSFCTLLLTFLAGCEDFVDVDPIGPVKSSYFTEADHFDKALIGAYDMLQSSFWNVQLATIASPDINAGGDPVNYDQPTLQDVDKMIHTQSTYVQIRDVWQNMYAGLNRTNFLLESKNALDFDGKDNILGQAYFLRAYYTFELAKFFGDIPLAVDTSSEPHRILDKQILFGDQFSVNRVGSQSLVFSLIEEDLKEAITLLPETQAEVWKASRYAAHSLLGKVLLFNKKFEESASQFQIVIESDKFELLNGSEFNNIWEESSENGPESIFEIQYTSVEGASWDCIICSEGTYMPMFNNPRDPYAGTKFIAGWGFNLPITPLYEAYKDGDSRRDLTIFDLRDDTTRTKSREDLGFFTKKYIVHEDNDLDREGSDPLNFNNNYRAIRYADVLLMAAEAYAETGNSQKAEEYLNKVRSRAFGNNDNNYLSSEGSLIDMIFNERRLELAAEGHYFFDLVRSERAKDAFDAYNDWINSVNPKWTDGSKEIDFLTIDFKVGKNEIFPIPLVELELANAVTRWGQNPGY
jgi:tetratricopeptide (TPR) repeat protein